MRRSVIVLVSLGALALAAPASAPASSTQETVLQDDTLLIYSPPQVVLSSLRAMKALGVDRLRVSVVWSLIAPEINSPTKPDFDATDPNAYPSGAWTRYDTLVFLAQQVGIKLYFQLTAPAPLWATPPRRLAQGYQWSYDPSATDFGQFAEAVGRRYAGLVHYWGIWNEPNIGGWMTPQWNRLPHGGFAPASPGIYRAMANDAYAGLLASGHAGDTILIGETAAYGFPWEGYGADMSPITFVQSMYCLSSRYRPLRGHAAEEQQCPASPNRGAFVADNPALFKATGWAHHPYDFHHPPGYHLKDPGAADLADLPRLEHALDRAQAAYGHRTRMPLYLTEWGYQTNPPDPYVKFTPAQQAAYLNQGEYMAWRDRRVRAFAQFLLQDRPPFDQYAKGTAAYWSSFQTGLIEPNGHDKPSYYAFRLPIWLPHRRHGRRVTVWGQLRPADHATTQVARLEYRPARSHRWRTAARITTRNSEGYFLLHVRLRRAGRVRIAWRGAAGGATEYSRQARVS